VTLQRKVVGLTEHEKTHHGMERVYRSSGRNGSRHLWKIKGRKRMTGGDRVDVTLYFDHQGSLKGPLRKNIDEKLLHQKKKVVSQEAPRGM